MRSESELILKWNLISHFQFFAHSSQLHTSSLTLPLAARPAPHHSLSCLPLGPLLITLSPARRLDCLVLVTISPARRSLTLSPIRPPPLSLLALHLLPFSALPLSLLRRRLCTPSLCRCCILIRYIGLGFVYWVSEICGFFCPFEF